MIRFTSVLLAGVMCLFTAGILAAAIDWETDAQLTLWVDFDREEVKDRSPKNIAFTALVPGILVEGIVDGAWQFQEGTEIGFGTALQAAFTQSTVMLWVQKSADSGILYEEGGGTNGLCVQISNQKLQYCTRDGGTATCLEADFPTNDEEWHLVTAVFDNGTMELYIDDELVASEKNVPGIGGHGNEGGIGKVGAGIAGLSCPQNAGQWTGIMDRLTVTRRAVTAQEIKEEFEAKGQVSVHSLGKLAVKWGDIKMDFSVYGK